MVREVETEEWIMVTLNYANIFKHFFLATSLGSGLVTNKRVSQLACIGEVEIEDV